MSKTYEDGLNEAWELVRDIITLPNSGNKSLIWVRHNVFRTDALFDLIMNYSASEIIEKIKKYEEIEVGDEVVDKNGWGIKGVITNVNENYISIVQDNGSVNRLKKDELNKTGRHFSQIEEVLQQIKEEDKGE
jgi:preprotein translocase subunit YajC